MSEKFTRMTPELYRYMVERGARQDELLRRVERETAALGDVAVMQIGPDEGALLTLLVRSLEARLAIEVGTFTGYGAICIARGLAPGGRLICLEIDEGYAETALGNLRAAGLDSVAEMRVGPALDSLRAMPATEEVDFAFIDADKTSYPDYYEELVARLRPGGVAVLDNVLLGGRVLDPPDDDPAAEAMARLNEAIAADERVDCAMVAVADGITLVRKR
jgi:caffeoyl-CoA O-methyltransferase